MGVTEEDARDVWAKKCGRFMDTIRHTLGARNHLTTRDVDRLSQPHDDVHDCRDHRNPEQPGCASVPGHEEEVVRERRRKLHSIFLLS